MAEEYRVLKTVREDGKVYEIRQVGTGGVIYEVDVTPEPVVPAPASKSVPDKQDAILSLLAKVAGVTDEKEISTHIHSVTEKLA